MTALPLFSDPDDKVELILAELQRVPGYPFDPAKDRPYVQELLDRYVMIDVLSEVRKWRAWMLDHESKKKVRHRARITTWLERAEQWRRTGPSGGGSARRSGVRGTPEGPEAFAASPDGLERW